MEIDYALSVFCEYGDRMDKLTEPQKNFYFNQNFEREVNNGGFNQYFFNSSGNFVHETVHSLNAIGASKTSGILQKAINQFPDKTVPKDRVQRAELLEKIESKANLIWEELDEKFYTYAEDLDSLNMDYIKRNKDKF